METTNLNIIEVKTYLEKGRISNSVLPFKTAVLKVKYDNGSWETIFRKILTYVPLNETEKSFMEQYKTLGFNQIRQVSCMLDEKQQKIFGLYLKKYFKYDLNIEAFIAKRNKKQYIENKVSDFLLRAKTLFQHATFNFRKLRAYGVSSENVTNI